jgi:hypothetical protein
VALRPAEPKLKGSVQGARSCHNGHDNPESCTDSLYGIAIRRKPFAAFAKLVTISVD